MVTRISTSGSHSASDSTSHPAPAKAVPKRRSTSSSKANNSLAQNVKKNVHRAVAGTLGITGERMTKVDTAWLRMDCAANLMMIVGVWLLKPGVSHAAVVQRIESTLLTYPRFRQRVMKDAAGATWVEDRYFDIANHVVRDALPPAQPGDPLGQQAALQDRVAALACEPLHPKSPLWQIHLIEDYTGPDGERGSAMVVRIHHCIADGIALISVTMALVDGAAGSARPTRQQQAKKPSAIDAFAEAPEDWIADTLLKPLTHMTVKALGALGNGAVHSLGLMGEPKKGLQSGLEKGVATGVDMAKVLFQVMADSAALALMPNDSPTRLKGTPGGAKKVAWCQPIALDDVRAIGKALGCSINDVLLSCVAGALAAYLQSHGDDTEGQEIRAMVPVNLRPAVQPGQQQPLGNRFGLVPLVLPIGIANPVQRVFEVRRRMAALKGSYQPLLAFSLLAVAGLLVKPAQDLMLNIFAKKTTAVMTNVPGPREKLKFCGSTLDQTLFWVPQSGDVGLGVSILSYGGGVQFGVITDSLLCPEPQHIVDAFMPEFERLTSLVLMLPWLEPVPR